MIMPNKHINFSESLLGFGSYILQLLKTPKSVDDIWKKYQSDVSNEIYFTKHSFDNFILTLIFLYSIGTIEDIQGKIKKCN
jgi:hypothetical protein